jgi:hypothetical protein
MRCARAGRALLLASGLGAARGHASDGPFRDATAEVGIAFHHFTGASGALFMPEIMGSGGALFDYDGDGDLDVYVVQGAPAALPPGRKASFPPPPGAPAGNRLFRNELVPSGRLRFTDQTEASGLGHQGFGMGVAVGDIDNDGDLDLYLTNVGRNVLFRNDGRGTFTDVTAEARADDPRWGTSAVFFDYDRDGDLDLFVANYVDFTFQNNKRCFSPTGEADYCTPKAYSPLRSRLLRNDGRGRFEDVTQAAGLSARAGPSLGVIAADLNADGFLDLYVANDGAANFLWMNRGGSTFEEGGLLSGAAYGLDGIARAGMGVDAGDFDDDGDFDLFVTNLVREGSVLFRNDGGAGFDDVSLGSGLAKESYAVTGFGAGWLDYDQDGRLDLFQANGAVTMMPAQRGEAYPFRQRAQLFRNEGQGAFREVGGGAGAFAPAEVGRGTALGDVDNDGDVDVLIVSNNGPARLLLNESRGGRHWLCVRLEGVAANRFGLGARVGVLREGQPTLWRRARTDGSYLSASDSRVHFGLDASREADGVVVEWPGGGRELFASPNIDRELVLRQGTGRRLPR